MEMLLILFVATMWNGHNGTVATQGEHITTYRKTTNCALILTHLSFIKCDILHEEITAKRKAQTVRQKMQASTRNNRVREVAHIFPFFSHQVIETNERNNDLCQYSPNKLP